MNLTGSIVKVILVVALASQTINLNNKGVELLKEGKLEEAAECFLQYLAENPDNVNTRYNLGIAYMKLEKWELSRTQFEMVCQEDSQKLKTLYHLAYTLYKLELFDKTVEVLKEFVIFSPGSEKAYWLLSLCYLKEGKYELAEVELKKSLEVNPEKREAMITLARIKQGQGQLEESLRYYQAAIEINPNKQSYYNKGLLLVKLDRKEEAKEAAERALAIDPAYGKANELIEQLKEPQPLPPLPKFETKQEIRDHYGRPDRVVEAESGGGMYEVWYFNDEKVVCSFLDGRLWEIRRYHRLKE